MIDVLNADLWSFGDAGAQTTHKHGCRKVTETSVVSFTIETQPYYSIAPKRWNKYFF